MKILIDTNILISAILRDKDPETVILWIVSQEDWQWIVTPQILSEYKDVLSREKFAIPLDTLQSWYIFLDRFTTLVDVAQTFEFPRDPKDAIFLSGAVAVQADYFITGDKDFTEAEKFLNTIILSVLLFKKLIVDSDATS